MSRLSFTYTIKKDKVTPMKLSSHPIIKGTFILTIAGLLCKLLGFFYKIFLSHIIGAEGLGIYQLVFTVHALAYALTAAGMQIAISRCCAASFSTSDTRKSSHYFYAGFFISTILSIMIAFIFYLNTEFLCTYILKEERCAPLLLPMILSIPFGTAHTCINAWHFSRQKATVPALSQLLEQAVRMISTYIIYLYFLEKQIAPAPVLAAWGILFSELAAMLFSVISLFFRSRLENIRNLSKKMLQVCGKELFTLSLPLTGNRLSLTLLQSMEAILLPVCLQAYGYSSSEAMSLYGVLTGMALPLILFPSAITGSVSMMLLPSVASLQAEGNTDHLRKTTQSTIKYCFFMGIFIAGICFVFGESIGEALFHNQDAGMFIHYLSFLCPMLYLGGTLSSILNGLGSTSLCFIQNIIGLLIRLLFVWFGIPHMGFWGFFLGLFISQLVSLLLSLTFIGRKISFQFLFGEWIVFPIAAMVLSVMTGAHIFQFLLNNTVLPLLLLLIFICGFCVILYGMLLFCMGLWNLPNTSSL